MEKSNLLGIWGEKIAVRYLKKKRYQILQCNYRCRFGEIDVICKNREYIVFVEVKLRKSAEFGEGREFVHVGKQNKIWKTASLWLQENPSELQPRFDVLEIYAPQGTLTKWPEITHLEDAFQ